MAWILLAKDRCLITISSIEPYHFDEEQAEERIKRQFKVGDLRGLGLVDHPMGVIATECIGYLHETQKGFLDHQSACEAYETSEFMIIDSSSRRNLETLLETLRDKQKKESLLWVLDKTKTAMECQNAKKHGTEQPLVDKKRSKRDTMRSQHLLIRRS